jgi:hypothetical protein
MRAASALRRPFVGLAAGLASVLLAATTAFG